MLSALRLFGQFSLLLACAGTIWLWLWIGCAMSDQCFYNQTGIEAFRP